MLVISHKDIRCKSTTGEGGGLLNSVPEPKKKELKWGKKVQIGILDNFCGICYLILTTSSSVRPPIFDTLPQKARSTTS